MSHRLHMHSTEPNQAMPQCESEMRMEFREAFADAPFVPASCAQLKRADVLRGPAKERSVRRDASFPL
jgi:hypothetical protein